MDSFPSKNTMLAIFSMDGQPIPFSDILPIPPQQPLALTHFKV